MAAKAVSAKEIVKDIRAGTNDSSLMKKYGLSQKGLETVFRELMEAGAIQE